MQAERILEPLQLHGSMPASLASQDPRVQVNCNGHMPYQVAQRLGFFTLAMLLRPSIPILRLFSDDDRAVRFFGPQPLKALAAEALNKMLVAQVGVKGGWAYMPVCTYAHAAQLLCVTAALSSPLSSWSYSHGPGLEHGNGTLV